MATVPFLRAAVALLPLLLLLLGGTSANSIADDLCDLACGDDEDCGDLCDCIADGNDWCVCVVVRCV